MSEVGWEIVHILNTTGVLHTGVLLRSSGVSRLRAGLPQSVCLDHAMPIILSYSETVLGYLCQGEEESVTGGRKARCRQWGVSGYLLGQAEMGSSAWVIQ